MPNHKITLRWHIFWLLLGWLGVIGLTTLSLIPLHTQLGVSYGDKIGHFIAYGVLMLWFVQLYSRSYHFRLGLVLIGLGVFIEIAQGQSGYRSFEYYDMLANSLGVLLSYGLAATPLAGGLNFLERHFFRILSK